MKRIGRYEILSELGRGAMGAVYKARDPMMDRTVAVKVILTANLTPEELEKYKQRFYREAQAAGKMAHPGIVTTHDIAEDESGHPYLVMEFIEGASLDSFIEKSIEQGERIGAARALDIAIQVARALDYAHRRGVIHRDIKPANILITQDGVAKIADFGIAKIAGTQLTQTGSVLGTPAFMSPEQFSGEAVDARSDLFSLAAILYWMCTGEKPFAGDTLTAVSFKIVFAEPIPARHLNPALPDGIDVVFSHCLAKSPSLRYPTGKDFADDLQALRDGRPIKAQPLPQVERTVEIPVNVAATPAAPAAPGKVERTQAVPALDATVRTEPLERTTPLTATRVAEKTSKPARDKTLLQTWAGVVTRPRRRAWLWWSLAAVGLLTVLQLSYQHWFSAPVEPPPIVQSRASKQPAEEPVAAPPVKEPAAEPSEPVRSPGKSSRSRRTPLFSGPMSTLYIDCQHNFRSAKLEVFSDDKLLYETTLRGDVQDLGVMKIAQGHLRASVELPAGERNLRVKVDSSSEGYHDEDSIGGRFTEDGSKTLLIEFGKGSGFRVVERKLALRWK